MATLNVGAGETYTTIEAAIIAANAGDTIHIANGTYTPPSQLNITKSLTIVGETQAGVIINLAGLPSGSYGIYIDADGTSLSNLTVNGPTAAVGTSFGIKIQPNSADPADRVSDITLENVTVNGSGRSEIDLNGVDGATLTNVTANGNGTAGNGISITDSTDVTLENITTSGNNWGSVALYNANRFYDQATSNVTFEGTYSATETIKIYAQDNSNGISGDGNNEINATSTNLSALTLPASHASNHGFQVQFNPGTATPYTYYFATEAQADAFLATLSGPQLASALLEEPNGDYLVKSGMSIQRAIDAATGGETINVYPGDYTESANYNPADNTNSGTNPLGLLVNKSVTIQGVDASGAAITDVADVVATVTASVQSGWGTNFHVTAADVTLSGLAFKGVGSAHQPYVNKAIEVIAGGFVLQHSVVTAVDNLPIYSAVYINDEDTTGADAETFVSSIDSYYIVGNTLYSSLVVTNGAGLNVVGFEGEITGNTFLNTSWVDPINSDDVNWPLLLTGKVDGVAWQNVAVAAPTDVSGNTVDLGVNTQILMRLRDEDPTALPDVTFVQDFTDLNDLGPYAYVLNALGELRLVQSPAPGQTASTFYMVASVDGVMSFDNAYLYGDPVPLAETGDTIVTFTGTETQDATVTIDDLKILAQQGSTDLNLTLGSAVITTAFLAAAPLGGVADITLLDHATGQGANVDVTGNDLDNTIIGNSGANMLDGAEGDDILNGGAGDDDMLGGDGDDTFYVDSIGDDVTENLGEGLDTVRSSISYTLSDNLENLVLTGSAQSGTGNALANTITGNALGNLIDGGLGADRMVGGAGGDTYVVNVAGDVVVEAANAGTDTVRSAVNYTLGANLENLALTGSAIFAFGNALANSITGNSGNNEIEGEAGRDVLTGGLGADDFNYDSIADAGKGSSRDVIRDFAHGIDDIDLHLIDANSVAGGNQAFTFIGKAAFGRTAGQLNYVQSGGKTIVQGDTNGDGAADFQIELSGIVSLSKGDFVL